MERMGSGGEAVSPPAKSQPAATTPASTRITTPPKMTFFHEAKCTSCHTERRFAGPHNVRGEMEQAVAHMRAMPDANFSDEDMAKIHGSLTMLRCVQCHGAEKLRLLAIKSPQERMQIIREMIAKPGSQISPDEASAIQRSYETMMGF